MRQDNVDVLLLSTYDIDGAGKFTHQLAKSLRSIGYSTRVVSIRNLSGDDNTFGIIDNSPAHQIFYRLSEELGRRFFRPRAEYAFIHLRALSDCTVNGSKVWPTGCRLIICTFLSGMMSPTALFTLRNRYDNPPIVFYGVDMNFYTGGCHYARDCDGYLNDCSDCPAVPRFLQGNVRRSFDEKKLTYQKIAPFVAVASSHEQYQQMSNSRAFAGATIKKILMAVDEEQFGKFESIRLQLRRERKCKGKVILIRSSSEPRKGCDIFIGAMRSLQDENPDAVRDITVLAIGDQYLAHQLKGCQFDIHSPGYIGDENELARLYAIADVFLMTSLADSGPVMLAQSLISGTPVISTDVGLARDLVHASCGGIILNEASETSLKKSIESFFSKWSESAGSIRLKVRKMAIEQLSTPVYLHNLSHLIKDVLNK